MDKVIFFDVDGTLTTTISGATFKQNPTDIKPIEGVEAGLRYFRSKDYTLIGISNQGGVAAGHKSIDETIEEMQNTLDLLPQIESIYICPDFEGNQAYKINPVDWKGFYRNQFPHPYMNGSLSFESFRKPGTGMIFKALEDFNLFTIEKDDFAAVEIWMIGDRPEDMETANQASINFLWANIFHQRFTTGIHEFRDLSSKEIEFLEF